MNRYIPGKDIDGEHESCDADETPVRAVSSAYGGNPGPCKPDAK